MTHQHDPEIVKDKPNGWLLLTIESGEQHVMPIADLRTHDETDRCWCKPSDDGYSVIHNAMDRREEYEGGRKIS